ncbi:lipid-binding SYLF domain-containing protein [Geomesophilobacter sediminis]|uniref:Lipid-binding SYLF domain-containing protein n=1 Tax=Geomesophilobacter sediminis TaxID=2798584 RepID=A0A8J7SDG1_9BACT|nr:lipid-binding SYLF domain-containing protein [Geomesophilobacter sediminis]MBJ6727799.1 lipid-binding SYLF domain-containing protein [Geomesophilobacter sediminis]
MKRWRMVFAAVGLLIAALAGTQAWAESKQVREIDNSAIVLKEIMSIPEKGIPPALLHDAHGLVIFPGVLKAAFVVGGRYGTGILVARDESGRWSDPVFVKLVGGSVGWQIGADATDIILVLKSAQSLEGILKGKVTLGADAAVAAGPVGRSAEAATDVTLRSEILSYSRSRGLFAGVSLEGAGLLIDKGANATFYGKKMPPRDILSGKVAKRSPEIIRLHDVLKQYAQ